VHKVSSGMERVQRDQDLIRGREARHRHTVESNEFRVPMWSIVNCLVMILATGFQVRNCVCIYVCPVFVQCSAISLSVCVSVE
jgi:hypothetical protein